MEFTGCFESPCLLHLWRNGINIESDSEFTGSRAMLLVKHEPEAPHHSTAYLIQSPTRFPYEASSMFPRSDT